MKPFPQGVDNRPRPFSDYINIATPSSSVATSITVPGSSQAVHPYLRITCATALWAHPNSSLAADPGAITDGTGPVLIPANTFRDFNMEGLSALWFLPVGASGVVDVHGEFWG